MTSILVVDDSEVDRRLAGGLLQKHPDWTVVYAADGQEALEQIELHLPEMVLTDLQMPGMNGLQLVDHIRKEYPLIPVILMTNKGSEDIAVQALQRGAASYVPKQTLKDDLREVTERVLAIACENRSHSRLLHRMTFNETHFELESDLSLIPATVAYLQGIVSRMRSCEETERLRIGVALEEALLNAYYHGNLEVSSELREVDHSLFYETADARSRMEPYCERKIYVQARISRDESVYVVRDEGPGFDPSCLPDPTDPANIERPCGRGLLLMQTFMDKVIFNETGNQVTMVKRRAAHPAPVLAGMS
jgi:CheY-like chemotaxis protein